MVIPNTHLLRNILISSQLAHQNETVIKMNYI